MDLVGFCKEGIRSPRSSHSGAEYCIISSGGK
nr:MAG TPA: hypothetical protein [Caudoviricetes sp.]